MEEEESRGKKRFKLKRLEPKKPPLSPDESRRAPDFADADTEILSEDEVHRHQARVMSLRLDAEREERYARAKTQMKKVPPPPPPVPVLTPPQIKKKREKGVKTTRTVMRGVFIMQEDGKLRTIVKAYRTIQTWKRDRSWLWWFVAIPMSLVFFGAVVIFFMAIFLILGL